MLIIKPYGRTKTVRIEKKAEKSEKDKTKENKQHLFRNNDPASGKEISGFVKTYPEIVIAQWISIIDKIARKPKQGDKAAKRQDDFRKKIGKACWDLITDKNLLASEIKRSEKIWKAKISPYEIDTKKNIKSDDMKGRWYKTFVGEVEPNKLQNEAQFKQIAEKIYQHLYEGEYRKVNAGTSARKFPQKEKGLMERRAQSIEKNGLTPIKAEIEKKWSDDDAEKYFQNSDIAQLIYKEANEEQDKKRKTSEIIAENLYAHYGKIFRADGKILSISEASTEMSGLFALHKAVKDSYKRQLRGDRRIAKALPKNADALKSRLEKRNRNRNINALIRLGKVLHYQSGDGKADSQENILAAEFWQPSKRHQVTNSPYWTSEGQAQIKRNEAFVRVWRNSIAMMTRSLKRWADAKNAITADITGGKEITKALSDEIYDDKQYQKSVALLFADNQVYLKKEDEAYNKTVLSIALKGVQALRNGSFHFKGRDGFLQPLQTCANFQGDSADEAAEEQHSKVIGRLKEMWQADGVKMQERLIDTMRAAHFEDYFKQQTLDKITNLVLGGTPATLPMPRLKRVLQRAENVTFENIDANNQAKFPHYHERLKTVNQAELKQPENLCHYTALKLLYRHSFSSWFAKQELTQLNIWRNLAIARTEQAAKNFNGELAIARAAKNIPFDKKTDTIPNFLASLTKATATEMRVQNHYESDAKAAREQAKYIDDFLCDIVSLAFSEFLEGKNCTFVLTLQAKHKLAGSSKSQLPENLGTDKSKAPEIEDWHAVLYFLLHLVPVEEAGRLLHQIKKWQILEHKGNATDKEQTSIQAVMQIFELYIGMHDVNYDGSTPLDISDDFAALFESEELFRQVFPKGKEGSNDHLPIRGLREMHRFGNLDNLGEIFENHKITAQQIARLQELEAKEGTSTVIAEAQKKREELHKDWVKLPSEQKKNFNKKTEYCTALKTVSEHRRLKAQIYLTNHVRLNRLMMAVLARLVDYAGLWERDLYFTLLALIYLQKKKPSEVFKSEGTKKLASGQVATACGSFRKTKQGDYECPKIVEDLDKYFDHLMHKDKRNKLAHFNMLQKEVCPNLTTEINDCRQLMSYDRKLKNAVSKSISDLLTREGLTIKWDMDSGGKGHNLTKAKVSTGQIKHIEDGNIWENLHGEDYVQMVASLLRGEFVESNKNDILNFDCSKLNGQVKSKQQNSKGGGKKG